jgi:hypothetical protein
MIIHWNDMNIISVIQDISSSKKKSKQMGATYRAGTAQPHGAPEFLKEFCGVHVVA